MYNYNWKLIVRLGYLKQTEATVNIYMVELRYNSTLNQNHKVETQNVWQRKAKENPLSEVDTQYHKILTTVR